MELTGKQKRFLRGMGQRIPVTLSLGNAGLTPAFARQLGDMLDRHELVKVHLPATSAADRKEIAVQLADLVQAGLAGVVGRTVLVYRPSTKLDSDQRIHLPASDDPAAETAPDSPAGDDAEGEAADSQAK